ncbi:16S rRNA (guanine(527)-N(7))-methyltransferase RsmG [Synechococcus sp. RSCCF101]|uniref:16S rRNA (guanine(527)-N(7))-methyltransferase RsmG n=1 Tax=Synechococcus sp. RSCCF101 TaxID=2511069 RepID=UPI00124795B7|nr:16S rRNA (guanine(527)-N(7))-methyltransferase RsmG [Synechococcus sp. RSCCF101]QEY33554.1 16S rRNA (guanine(527)-N(7))-methyltransferase RsmG [Synechococcus sp. RSCCF101]
MEQLRMLQNLLLQWNQRLNLTRLVEGDDYWIAQVVDSLWPLLPWIERGGELEAIDVGTGCGFPGLALAIALPGARVCLVDSVGRKLEAVQAMAAALGLAGRVRCRHERIELTGRDRSCRGRFDLALARAVAPGPVVAEYLMPLLAPSGRAVLYRGHWSEEDQQGLSRALRPLKGTQLHLEQRRLPADRGLRTAIVLAPDGPCPQAYPRAVGVAGKHPLGTVPAAGG